MKEEKKPLVYMLINTSKLLKQRLREEFESDHPFIPYELLSHLDEEGKSLKALSQSMQCSKQEVTRLVQRAKDNNWVDIRSSPLDGRSKLVYYSDFGKNALTLGMEQYYTIENQWKRDLGEDDMEAFRQTLEKVNGLLKKTTSID